MSNAHVVAVGGGSAIAAALGVWLGFTPASATGSVPAPPTAAAAQPDPKAVPCVVSPRSLRPVGIRKPTSSRIDPELDPELVGRPSPTPSSLPPGWSEAELRALFAAPGVTIDCSEWPCMLEQRAPDHDPRLVGDALSMEAVMERLEGAGLEHAVRGSVFAVGLGDAAEEVLVMALVPGGAELSPEVDLRTRVRMFWTEEAHRP